MFYKFDCDTHYCLRQPIGMTLTPSGRVYATSPPVKTAKKLGLFNEIRLKTIRWNRRIVLENN